MSRSNFEEFYIYRRQGNIMSSVPKVVCINCGREIRGVKAAKSDGWLLEDSGEIFCCCVCKGEYNSKKKRSKK